MRRATHLVLLLLVFLTVSPLPAQPPQPSPIPSPTPRATPEIPVSTFDPTTLQLFTDVHSYLGEHKTGLYPDGNTIPEAHRKAGERLAAQVQPLDAAGKPDAQNGRILALVMGHSNCSMYFQALGRQMAEKSADLHPRFELINAAVGGQQLPQLVRLEEPVWKKAQDLLAQSAYSPAQVQVLFLHTTYQGAQNRSGAGPGPFPDTMKKMQADLATVLEHCVKTYPNLRIAYLTSDGFRHYTGFEPHVWQEAFALKWLIESQIRGEAGTAFEGADRRLPWLQWGPYIWDNAWDRSYFSDGVHPAAKAQAIFVGKYWDFLRADPVGAKWLMKPAP